MVHRRVGHFGDVEALGQETDAAVDLAQAFLAVEVVAILRAVAVLGGPRHHFHHLGPLHIEQRDQLFAQPLVAFGGQVVARAGWQGGRSNAFVILVVAFGFLGECLVHARCIALPAAISSA